MKDDKKKQASGDVSEDIQQMKELFLDAIDHFKESVASKSQDSIKTAYKYAADEPLKSVGIALLAGFVLGICLKS